MGIRGKRCQEPFLTRNQSKDIHVDFMDGEGRPALFTRVRDETAETPSETGARSREGGRHT